MRQNQLDDLARQINKFIGTANAVMERYSRSMEEIDYLRLTGEELKELLKDFTEEAGIWADGISRRIDRLEQFVILSKIGNKHKAGEITQEVGKEHIERTLREDLAEHQKLLLTYQRNIMRVKERIAKQGYDTIEQANQLEDYERESAKLTEAINRIRETLKP